MTAPRHPGQSRSRRPLVITAVLVALAAGGSYAVHARRASTSDTGKSAPAGTMASMPGMTAGAGDGTVHLDAAQLRQFGVTFDTVGLHALSDEVRTVGTVTADETRITTVAPKVGGFVERLYVNATGQPVRRGQALAAIYSPELLAAQEELLVAKRLDATDGAVPGVPGGGSLLAAARQRLRLLDVSDAQIDAVLRSGRAQRTVTLVAQSAGVVSEKHVTQGQAVQAGMPLYTLTDLSELWVEVQLRAADAGSVHEGTIASVTFSGVTGAPITGRVAYVYPTVGEATRTLAARVVVPNPGGRLRPGMYATVRLSAPTRTVLAVPRAAVIETGERAVVFVDMGRGELMPHEVSLGRVAGDYVELLGGVGRGARVVTSAQYLLESESNIAQAMKGMAGMGPNAGGSTTGGDVSGMRMPAAGAGGASGTAATPGLNGADTRGMPSAATPAPRTPR
jgi:membrane fusion protein, copper/silver efflux system